MIVKYNIMLVLFLFGLMTSHCNRGVNKNLPTRTADKISIQAAADAKITSEKKDSITLKGAYQKYFPVGAPMFYHYLSDAKLRNFVASQYSSITVPNLKARTVQPKEGFFDFSQTDPIVDFAVKNKMKIRGHCLIWFWNMPDWFFKENGKKVSRKTLLIRMERHINVVMQRYKGKIYCWDVVNEAMSPRQNEVFKKADTFYQVLGEDYVEIAFRMARKADPKAKLYYNDSFNADGKKNKTYGFIKKLKAKGVPIDGIGIQGHYGLNSFTEQSLKEEIALFKNIGLDIQFTEVDIPVFDRIEKEYIVDKKRINSINIEAKQAKQYEVLFRVSRQDNAVKGITLWGGADWPNFLTREVGVTPSPYLFDKEMKPKKAFYSVVNF